jgi:hypothetical protein
MSYTPAYSTGAATPVRGYPQAPHGASGDCAYVGYLEQRVAELESLVSSLVGAARQQVLHSLQRIAVTSMAYREGHERRVMALADANVTRWERQYEEKLARMASEHEVAIDALEAKARSTKSDADAAMIAAKAQIRALEHRVKAEAERARRHASIAAQVEAHNSSATSAPGVGPSTPRGTTAASVGPRDGWNASPHLASKSKLAPESVAAASTTSSKKKRYAGVASSGYGTPAMASPTGTAAASGHRHSSLSPTWREAGWIEVADPAAATAVRAPTRRGHDGGDADEYGAHQGHAVTTGHAELESSRISHVDPGRSVTFAGKASSTAVASNNQPSASGRPNNDKVRAGELSALPQSRPRPVAVDFPQAVLYVHQGEVLMTWKRRLCRLYDRVLLIVPEGGEPAAGVGLRLSAPDRPGGDLRVLEAGAETFAGGQIGPPLANVKSNGIGVTVEVMRPLSRAQVTALPGLDGSEVAQLRFCACSKRDALQFTSAFRALASSM